MEIESGHLELSRVLFATNLRSPRAARVFVPNKLYKSELNNRAGPARPVQSIRADNTQSFRIAVRDEADRQPSFETTLNAIDRKRSADPLVRRVMGACESRLG